MILVSAGHHAGAQGAKYGPYTEWPIAMLWRKEILRNLKHRAHAVPSGLLRDKVDYINERDPVLAIEIHFNSTITPSGRHVGEGCECLYTPEDHRSRHAAQQIQIGLASVFHPDRGVHEGWLRRDYPGRVDYQGDVEGDENLAYFLQATRCPAVIIEPEFIHRMETITEGMGLACLEISNAIVRLMNDWDI